MWYMFVIPFSIFFIFFLAVAFSIASTSRKVHKTIKKNLDEQLEDVKEIIFTPVVEPKKEEVYCEYCGEPVKDGQKKCASCGARIKSK